MGAAARLLGVAGTLALCACGSGGAPAAPPSGCFAGDSTAVPAVRLVSQTADGTLAPISDGDMLPLVVPPQGGQVLVVGVRALNVDGCSLTISASLVVPQSGVVATFERRPVTLQVAADGWLEPKNPAGLANFANVPACPIAGLGQDVDGQPYLLTVAVEDPAGRQGQASATVVPTCDQSAAPAACQCVCGASYVLGTPCS